MSMFHGAMSASLIGLPYPAAGFAGVGVAGCTPAQPAATRATAPASTLYERIFHLARRIDRPRLDAVVVLDEAGGEARFLQVRDRRLHIARRVDGSALQHCRG